MRGGEPRTEATQAVASKPVVAEHDDGSVTVSAAPSAGSSQAPPTPPGVIVRFKEQSAFERHARERAKGRAAARAAAASQRLLLRTEHTRLIEGLRTKLGGLTLRRGKGRVVGKSFDDFTDVLNGIALYGVDGAAAEKLFAREPGLLSIEPIRQVEATLTESVPLIDADDVWAIPDGNGVGIDGTGMRIGIVDTGVDYTHPDLGGCFGPGCKVAGGYDFVNHDADPMDDNGHGTHVAATAAGNGSYVSASGPRPIRGVAPGAEVYAYKVLGSTGSGSTPDIIAAIERCADPNTDGDPSDHLDVCNLSLGGPGTPDDAQSAAVDNATANGVVFAISAGNSGPGASTVGSPGTARRAITVAAACKPSAVGVDSRCAEPIASFSSRGPVVWNGSGGLQSLAKPDVSAPGVSICAAELGATNSSARCLDGRHVQLSGTSMASPHVAGVAALLCQAHPEWTPDQVKTFIVTSARSLGLDPLTQGTGMVDVLDAVTLGGVPSSIARIGGTPLHDLDVPTSRYGVFASDITLTNTTTSSLTFASAFSGDTGLTVTLSPPSITVGAGATGTMTVTRRVDHDVVPSGMDARGTITLSSTAGNLALGVAVGVRDRLTATPALVDVGVDLATLSTFSQTTTLQLTNLRADAAQTYAASIACCGSGAQFQNPAISAFLDQSSISVGPGGSATLGVTVSVTNGSLPNGRYQGSISLTSTLGSFTVPVTFFKGYGVRVDTASTPQFLALSSEQSGSATTIPVSPSTTFYSTTPGPFFVEATWPYLTTRKHVLAVASTDVPMAVVSLDPAQAVYTWQLRPRDQTGAFPLELAGIYRFTHSASGGGVFSYLSGVSSNGFPIYVSAVPEGINFTASLVGAATEPLAFLYELAGPVAANRTFDNAPGDLLTKEIRVFRPTGGANAPVFVPEACLTLNPWSPATPGGAIPRLSANCSSAGGLLVSSGTGRMRFFNSANRDLLAAPYPDAPFASYELHDGAPWGATLYRGPLLYPSATHPLTWTLISPWSGTVRANEAYARFQCEEAPGNLLAVGPGPLLDQWAFWNHRTDFSAYRGAKGQFQNPFGWGGCVQDSDTSTFPVSYRLFRNGSLVQSGTVSGVTPPFWSLSDGQYRYEMTRSALISGQTTQVETVSTFGASASSSIDENPPALQSLHLLGRGLWQDVADTAVANRLRFHIDPLPGFADYGAGPPLFTSLADDLVTLKVEQGTDGQSWSNVPTNALGSGDYLTDTLLVDAQAPLVWLRISATDLAGNTLRYTFQVPRGASYATAGADLTPPSTAITSPAAGAVLNGTTEVTATATDDVGVTRVDLLVDHVKVDSALATPYGFGLSAATLTPGAHELQTRAEDAGGNIGFSAPISVTVQNPDTSPPTVAFTAPAPGAVIRQTVTLTATASDDNAVQRVEFRDGATLLGAATAAPYVVSWNTAASTSGAHALAATAYDAAGNATTATLSVTVDNNPPSVVLSAPSSGATVSGAVVVTATATDDVAVAQVAFFRDGIPIGTSTAAPFSVTWNTATLALGNHTLSARALDSAGNSADSASVSVTVVADASPPSVTILSPVEGGFLGSYIIVTIDAHDDSGVATVELYDQLGLLYSRDVLGTLGPQYQFFWDASASPDGPRTFTARAIDSKGNVGVSVPVHLTADKVPPVLSVTAPLDSAHVSGLVPIQANATDAAALDSVTVYIDDVPFWTGTAPPFATTWNTTETTDGWHSVAVRATDKALNSTLEVLGVYVDNTSIAVALSSPANGTLVGKNVPVTATTTNDAGVASIAFFDGATSIGSVTSPPFGLGWTPATAGLHTLTAKATDRLGRVTTSPAVTVTADIVTPNVSLTAPANGATVADTVQLAASASDDTAVSRVEFYDSTTLLGTDTTAPYTFTWNTTGLPLGTHSLTARAYDSAGNSKTSTTVTVTVASDLTPPVVSVSAPAAGAVITGTVAWTAVASDNVGVTSVQLRDGSTVVTTLNTSPYTFNWNTTSVSSGSHSLTARAFDAAGNASTSAAVTVTIDRSAPTVSLTAPAAGATISGSATVSANASDTVGVARVEFYRDNTVLLGTDATSPYSLTWNTGTTPAGSHTLKAIAYDKAGNSTTSSSRTVTVKDVTLPTVSITSPTNGATVTQNATVTIGADAVDETGVTKVQFLVANGVTCTDTTAPYTCSWRVPSGAGRTYALVAKASDAAGNTRSSTTVTVTAR